MYLLSFAASGMFSSWVAMYPLLFQLRPASLPLLKNTSPQHDAATTIFNSRDGVQGLFSARQYFAFWPKSSTLVWSEESSSFYRFSVSLHGLLQTANRMFGFLSTKFLSTITVSPELLSVWLIVNSFAHLSSGFPQLFQRYLELLLGWILSLPGLLV